MKALRALFAVVACLILLEVVARLVQGAYPEPRRKYPTPEPGDHPAFKEELFKRRVKVGRGIPMIADLQTRWALAPTTARDRVDNQRINELGLRGAELRAPAPGEARLMTLGDSSVFGVDVLEDDVFSQVAAAQLSRRWARPVRGIIGGVPGYDSGQSLQLLRRVGRAVSPTFVVIGNIWSDLYRATDGLDAWRINQAWRISPLARRSALYCLLRNALGPLLRPIKVRFIAGREDVGAGGGGLHARVSLGQYAQNLNAIARLARSLGATPVFLLLPAAMDFDQVPLPDPVMDYREAMRQAARRHGALLLDGVKVFRRTHQEAVWFIDQVHPSPEGHFLLGKALADLLGSELPSSAPD